MNGTQNSLLKKEAERFKLAQKDDIKMHCLAKALYDNSSESPDELSFKKGDILTVLEQNSAGLEGWWLCSLRGRQGIAPGNRLRLIPGMFDPTGLGYAGSTSPNGSCASINLKSSSSSSLSTVSSLQNSSKQYSQSRRRSWHINSNRVVTPQRIGDVYLYDIPVAANIPVDNGNQSDQTTCNISSLPVIPAFRGKSPVLAKSYETPPSPRSVTGDEKIATFTREKSSSTDLIFNSSCVTSEVYDIPPSSTRTLNDATNDDVVAYDVPPQPCKITADDKTMSYDVPISHNIKSNLSGSSSSLLSPTSNRSSLEMSLSISSFNGSNRSSLEQNFCEMYDFPQSCVKKVTAADSPTPTNENNILDSAASPQLEAMNNLSPSRCANNQANACQLYDVPLSNLQIEHYDIPKPSGLLKRDTSLSSTTLSQKVDCTKSLLTCDSIKKIELDANSAITKLLLLQQEVQLYVSELLSFINTPNWRSNMNPEATVNIVNTCHSLGLSVKMIFEFCAGVLVNSLQTTDKSLSNKLSKLLNQLNDSNLIIARTIDILNSKGWSIDRLAANCTDEVNKNFTISAELDQLVACSRGLTEDVKHIVSFIRTNSTILFVKEVTDEVDLSKSKPIVPSKPAHLKSLPPLPPPAPPKPNNLQSRPLPPLPREDTAKTETNSVYSCNNDYDYISLEKKKVNSDKEDSSIKVSALPKENNLVRIDTSTYDNLHDCNSKIQQTPHINNIESNDEKILHFYSSQLETLQHHLTLSIDAFIQIINQNQPPKVFVSHSKFVIISAQKLIYIGDTVNRNLHQNNLKNQIVKRATCLCDSLKTLVLNTKKAALHFPSVRAVQDMLDCVVDVSHYANNLKLTIQQAVKC